MPMPMPAAAASVVGLRGGGGASPMSMGRRRDGAMGGAWLPAESLAGGRRAIGARRKGIVRGEVPPTKLLALRGGVREIEDRADWEALLAHADESGLLLVVDFTAVWCGPCQRIAPVYTALADEYAETAILVKADVDILGDLAAELGVTSMPTFLFFRSGEVVDSMRGADEAALRALVAEHAVPALA